MTMVFVTLYSYLGAWLYCEPRSHARTNGYLNTTDMFIKSRMLDSHMLNVLSSALSYCRYFELLILLFLATLPLHLFSLLLCFTATTSIATLSFPISFYV